MKIVINNIEYKLVENNRECFDLDEVKEKLDDVDYFDNFDYILGDYSYDKLRMKGFYKKGNKAANEINTYDKVKDYIENYCSYGCKYFVLERIKENSNKNWQITWK